MISIQTLISNIKINQIIGNPDAEVSGPINLDTNNTDKSALMWGSERYYETYKNVKQGVLLCNRIEAEDIQTQVTYILADNPRKVFMHFLKMFQPEAPKARISDSAKIHDSVVLGENCSIGEHVVIESGCQIGNNVIIDHNTVIKQNTIIEDEVKIGCSNVIGAVGFGYEMNDEGEYEVLPHIGNVWIKKGVEIGNNNAIDRAVMGSTILRENVKVDNLVHIAHGVDIGRNSLIIANAMIAGSCKIGENVWVAPSSSILNKVNVDSDAVIGMGCVVLRSVDANAIVVGNPGKVIKYKS